MELLPNCWVRFLSMLSPLACSNSNLDEILTLDFLWHNFRGTLGCPMTKEKKAFRVVAKQKQSCSDLHIGNSCGLKNFGDGLGIGLVVVAILACIPLSVFHHASRIYSELPFDSGFSGLFSITSFLKYLWPSESMCHRISGLVNWGLGQNNSELQDINTIDSDILQLDSLCRGRFEDLAHF